MAFIEASLEELPVSAKLGQSCLATKISAPGPSSFVWFRHTPPRCSPNTHTVKEIVYPENNREVMPKLWHGSELTMKTNHIYAPLGCPNDVDNSKHIRFQAHGTRQSDNNSPCAAARHTAN